MLDPTTPLIRPLVRTALVAGLLGGVWSTLAAQGFGPPQAWTSGPFYGTQGTYFADVTGDGRADAIASNTGGFFTVRRSTSTAFGPDEGWAQVWSYGNWFADVNGDGLADAIQIDPGQQYGTAKIRARVSTGSSFPYPDDWTAPVSWDEFGGHEYRRSGRVYFADVTGDGKADAIVVGERGITVHRSSGSRYAYQHESGFVCCAYSGPAFYGTRGTFFADVTGDGKADAIAVNDDGITVRRSDGTTFGGYERWAGPFIGTLGTYVVDVTGDGLADAIAVTKEGPIWVARSTGSAFAPGEDWSGATTPFVGTRGTFFADVNGDRRADAIAVGEAGITVRLANAPTALRSVASLSLGRISKPASAPQYRVVALGARVDRETIDDPLDRDGKRDEVYFAALVRQFDRRDQRLLFSANPLTSVMGDRNGYPARIQAGTAGSLGGIRAGDRVPAVADVGTYRAEPVPSGLPLELWRGELRDGIDVVVIVPEVWEWDGDQQNYGSWISLPIQAQDNAIQQLIAARQLGPTDLLGGAQWLSIGSAGAGHDRPIGYEEIRGMARWRASTVVVTREAVEQALQMSSTTSGLPAGTIQIHRVGSAVFGGDYWLYLRVERVP